ncbi:hypothetical protein QWY93_00595 [Echinicola jeungdonensis]|uniref:Uncharacterized protein n=1 Tax=Echinicola jeungdonensis TaxID=709343 RepID=A0ABV5J0Q2_9BACT|nr:hypothetical protein [Echinicola jeungdonensis]MDN3667839.1 hypothetical protein [Echinicola jeungdonensis]
MLFFGLIVFTPAIVVLVKSNVDVSICYSVVEEEENSENTKTSKEHLIKKEHQWVDFSILSIHQDKFDPHKEKNYAFVMPDQFCPPPELS